MRILSVRFKNLNSLAGEWEIDFTHPAYAADGIFAITGPTGAGKTTILDAVCLALFGRTHRLDRINAGSNEIMSRHTGDCFAEAVFAAGTRRYRCFWRQHRARHDPAGRLREHRHEIADADTGAVLAVGAREVPARVEEASGMNFLRFSRSMLLAQGDFNAFLNAGPDERGPLLEQITGARIYAGISRAVQRRHVAEQNRLQALRAELGAFRLLEAGEEGELRAELETSTARVAAIAAETGGVTAAMTWLEGMAAAREELEELRSGLREAREAVRAFAPEADRLRRALAALELAGAHSSLVAEENALASLKNDLLGCREALPGLEAEEKRARRGAGDAGVRLEEAEKALEEARPVFSRVRALDQLLAERALPLLEEEKALAALTRALEGLRLRQGEDAASLEGMRRERDGLREELARRAGDAALAERIEGISERYERAREREGLAGAAAARSLEAAELAELGAGEFEKAGRARAEAERNFRELETARARGMAGLAAVLAGHDEGYWHRVKREAGERRTLCAALETALADAAALAGENAGVEAAGAELAERVPRLAAEAGALAARLAELEERVGLLRDNLRLRHAIQSYDEARRSLRDGEECPLCGSREHPFSLGVPPAAGETEDRLAGAEAELSSLRKEELAKRVALAEAESGLRRNAGDRRRLAAALDAAAGRVEQARAALGQVPETSGPEIRVSRLAGEASREEARADEVLSRAEKFRKEESGREEDLARAAAALAGARENELGAAHRRDAARKEAERLAGEAEEAKARRDGAFASLRELVAPFGEDGVDAGNFRNVLARLIARRDGRREMERRVSALDGDIAVLEGRLHLRGEQLRRDAGEVETRGVALAGRRDERDALEKERRSLYGGESPDDGERRLEDAAAAARAAVAGAREGVLAAELETRQLRERTLRLEEAVAAKEAETETARRRFLEDCRGKGFSGMEAFVAGVLPEAERRELEERRRALSERERDLEAREREKRLFLLAEEDKRLTPESLDGLKTRRDALVAEAEALQRGIGALRARLGENAREAAKRAECALAAEAQVRECARWDGLNMLIGSHDGKKFRNFAQGLTFETLLKHANAHLRRIGDRYLLLRREGHPLELEVMDNYQGGAVRSVKNLSGGEQFLVSLSLALGLSGMASRGVRVESLFLDEGFGSLDDDALDSALGALACLRGEGKLIGAISHVPALKDRIATQIEVVPLTGGRGRISGPGCRAL